MTLSFWIRTAAAFVFRSGRTTLALGLMIALAVAALIFVAAVATGVNDCMIRNSTGLYTGGILGTNLPDNLSPRSLHTPGVDRVLQRFSIPGSLARQGDGDTQTAGFGNTGAGRLGLTLVALDPAAEKQGCFLWKKIVAGSFLAPETSGAFGEPSLLISSRTAGALSAVPGDMLTFQTGEKKVPMRVLGIFETGVASLDQGLAFCSSSDVAPLPKTWQAAVFLVPGVSGAAVREAWAKAGIDPAPFRTWEEAMPDLTQLIDLNRISMGFVMVLVLGVVAFATACAFAIFIISRLREYGIMKAMGITAKETALLIFSQVVCLNLIAAAGGILLGSAAVLAASHTGIDLGAFTSHNRYFVVSGVIFPRLTPFSLVLPPALALAFCLVSAAWPVTIVIRQEPAGILRSI